jgi:hypothetical protein
MKNSIIVFMIAIMASIMAFVQHSGIYVSEPITTNVLIAFATSDFFIGVYFIVNAIEELKK